MYYVDEIKAYILSDNYATFWKTITWYRMYCTARFGKDKADYKKGFESLKSAFTQLERYDNVSKYIKAPIEELFDGIQKKLGQKNFSQDDIAHISNLLWEFEKKQEDFTGNYLPAYLRELAQSNLPKGMQSIIWTLENGETNAAIVESFKYLDKILQSFLGVSPHEYYGEPLVNLAFSQNDGKMKLDTHENEQRGLRNFASGFYALFRNPAAHRDIFSRENGIIRHGDQEEVAATIVQITNLLTKVIYENVFKNLDSQIRNELTQIAINYKWNQEIMQFSWQHQYHWAIGLLPEAKNKALRDYQLVVTLTEDEKSPHLKIYVNTEIGKNDINGFVSNIKKISNLRIVLQEK